MKITLCLTRLLGIVFLLSAALKALDWTAFSVQISYYGIVREPWVVRSLALGVIGLEAALGMALLLGIALRRATLPAVLALLGGFTALLGWAWIYRDIQDCGCFGKYLQMGPAASIAKNIVLMALAAAAWLRLGKETQGQAENRESLGDSLCAEPQGTLEISSKAPDACAEGSDFANDDAIGSDHSAPIHPPEAHKPPRARQAPRLVAATLGALAIMGFALVSPFDTANEAPTMDGQSANEVPGAANSGNNGEQSGKLAKYTLEWKGQRLDLSRGTYLVALLSDSCSHCAQDVQKLNRLTEIEGVPPIVGLILGEEDSLQQFRDAFKPAFPTRLIPVLEFFNLIGDAPPRYILAQGGHPLQHWDHKIPSRDAFLGAVMKIPIVSDP